jgi:phosphate transport system substrate-binding protein
MTRMTLAGASALAILAATAAQAQTPVTTLYGGGGTLAAKIYRDVFNCYSSLGEGVYATSPGNPANVTYPTARNNNCTTPSNVGVGLGYEPVGSGAGLNAYTQGNPASFGSPATTNTIAYLNTSIGLNSTPYPEIQFAGSDAYLNSTQASQAAAIDGGFGQFQLPTIVTPIVLPIGQTKSQNLTGNGTSGTTTSDVCNIFSGRNLTTSSGLTIQKVVVRADGSGTSFIFSDWLAQNCDPSYGFTAANGFPSTLPNWSAVFTANGANPSTQLTSASGSGGVAGLVAANKNWITYVSPDFVFPVVTTSTAYPATVDGKSSAVNTKNVGKVTGCPTNGNTCDQVAFQLKNATYPAKYNPATYGQLVNDSLAAPTPAAKEGYPIIGYTFIDTYACYNGGSNGIPTALGTATKGTELKAALQYIYSAANKKLYASQGFDPANSKVNSALKSPTGPFNASKGIQGSQCP